MLSNQTAWGGFKIFPPSSKVATIGQLGLEGSKTFEEIVMPQNADARALPAFSFSFFNPDDGQYHTLTQPPVPLAVHSGGAAVMPAMAVTKNFGAENQTPQDILPIMENLGTLGTKGAPFVAQPAFLAVQSLPVLAFLAAFIWRELTCHEPIVQLHVLGERNFCIGIIITTFFGVILYGITALLPLFLQTLMGYPAMDSGLASSPRGLGSLISMFVVSFLIRWIDERILLAIGFFVLALSSWMFCRINLMISMNWVAWPMFTGGLAAGFVFVPLTTLTMSRLQNHEIGNASGIYNLMRNIGGSFGIAMITTFLARGSQQHQNYLVAHVNPAQPQLSAALAGLTARLQHSGMDMESAHRVALALMGRMVAQQSALLAYLDNFRLLGWMAAICIPLLLFLRKGTRNRA